MNGRPTITSMVAAIAVLVGFVSAQATVLTFDLNNDADADPTTSRTPGFPLLSASPHNAYGDNVSGTPELVGGFSYHYGSTYGFTPNVTVAYSAATGNTKYYNDAVWPGADYLELGTTGSRQFYYTFTPSGAGTRVAIRSFDLFGYNASTLSHDGTWKIYRDTIGGTLHDSGSFSFNNTFVYTNPFSITTAGVPYLGTLVLEVDHVTGNGGGFALDNLGFEQQVPEPSSIGVLALNTFLIRRRRR